MTDENRVNERAHRRIAPASVLLAVLSLLAAGPAQAQNLPDVDEPKVDEPKVDEPDVEAPDANLPGSGVDGPTDVSAVPGADGGSGGNGSDPGDSSGESSDDNSSRDPGEVFDETGRTQGRRSPLYLNPFPVVRIRGAVYGGSTRIDLLRVLRPAGSRVYTRCRGRGCPFPGKASGFSVRTGVVPFGSWRRRSLRAGAVLEVFVTRPGTVGKYTRLTMRSGRFPVRFDGCVQHGQRTPTPCAR